MALTYQVFQQNRDGTDVGSIATFTTFNDAWEKLLEMQLATDADTAIFVIRTSS